MCILIAWVHLSESVDVSSNSGKRSSFLFSVLFFPRFFFALLVSTQPDCLFLLVKERGYDNDRYG